MKKSISLHASVGDKALWQQTLAGDKQAFGQLYVRFYHALKHYGRRLADDDELIEDSIQDLFLTVWQTRQSLNANAPAGYYLASALRHAINRRLMKQLTTESPSESSVWCQSSEDDYLKAEEEHHRKHLLDKALRRLSPRQQQVLHLHFFEAKSHHEIRQIMQISSQSVYNALCRSLKTLRATCV
ncbi:RNA polymerase sigma factor [Fibrisoma montanum]|nr:sigma-70 family RNA polymerase sigma factor [Fibrisoma montanum]